MPAPAQKAAVLTALRSAREMTACQAARLRRTRVVVVMLVFCRDR
jgi:hypothetical protein